MSRHVLRCGSVAAAFVIAAAAARSADEGGTRVEKCGKSFGTLMVADPRGGVAPLQRFGLGSPTAVLRMMIQQSGCFDVVERGAGMQDLQQERLLVQSGDLRQDSNLGKGQMQAADFVMTPDVQIPVSNTGGIGGGLTSMLGKLGPLSSLAGNLKFKEANTSLLVSDVRSGIQVAGAEGKASKTEFDLGALGGAAGVGGALGGYANSPEGKIVAASLLDNYNRIVVAIRDQPQLIKPSSAAADNNAAVSTRAEAPQQAGQMLQARIANVKVYAEPSRESAVVATLQRSDEMIASGEAKNGFARIDAANFSGWVQRTLVAPAVGAAQGTAPAPVPAAGGLVGQVSGNFFGNDRGNFQLNVSGPGPVSGMGMSATAGQFLLSGQIDQSGALALQSRVGSDILIMFSGRLDPATGFLSGNWQFANRPGGGQFSGQRRP